MDDNIEEGNSNSNINNDDDNLSNELSNMNIKSGRNRNCLYCLKEVEGSSRCSKCRTALYCNRECQEKHWPAHENSCRDSNNAEDSTTKLSIKAENQFNQGKLSAYIY